VAATAKRGAFAAARRRWFDDDDDDDRISAMDRIVTAS
jgi:hypothetical protein